MCAGQREGSSAREQGSGVVALRRTPFVYRVRIEHRLEPAQLVYTIWLGVDSLHVGIPEADGHEAALDAAQSDKGLGQLRPLIRTDFRSSH